MNVPATGLMAGLTVLGAWVSTVDTISIEFQNTSVGAINEAAADWSYLLVR